MKDRVSEKRREGENVEVGERERNNFFHWPANETGLL